jgi:nucleotide-binding universal stress UspA family protein
MTVLVPIDGSENSFRALEHAATRADAEGVDLHVVHVAEERTAATDQLVERAADLLVKEGVEDDPEVVETLGQFDSAHAAGDAIVDIVGDGDEFDHVVMGHHDHEGNADHVLGSTSQTVLDADVVPVTVVP